MTALVFVGLYQDDKGVSSWTNGLCSFGKDELEVINSSQSPAEVADHNLQRCLCRGAVD